MFSKLVKHEREERDHDVSGHEYVNNSSFLRISSKHWIIVSTQWSYTACGECGQVGETNHRRAQFAQKVPVRTDIRARAARDLIRSAPWRIRCGQGTFRVRQIHLHESDRLPGSSHARDLLVGGQAGQPIVSSASCFKASTC